MHFTAHAVSRLTRSSIGQALTATSSTAVRHSSSSSTDEFVEQLVGKQDRSFRITKVPSPLESKKARKKATKIQAEEPFSWKHYKRSSPRLLAKTRPVEIRKIRVPDHLAIKNRMGDTTSWKNPDVTWPENPPTASRPRVLNLRRLPLATTPEDIILSIDNAAHERKVSKSSTIIADIVIEPRSDSLDEVDATVMFLHPHGAQTVHVLAVDGHLKVQGVVPETFLTGPQKTPETAQPSKDAGTAQLPKVDRAEDFTSPKPPKFVPPTLIYS